MKKLKLAVIGKDVSQSLSPAMQTFIAENTGNFVDYSAVSIPEEQFEDRIDEILETFDGINVTIPYKLKIIPHLSRVYGDAKTFGAVNTVRCGDKSGYNTDGKGFALMLESNGVKTCGEAALVLGAGGAGRSVALTLSAMGCSSVSFYDCNSAAAERAAAELGLGCAESPEQGEYGIIINATGVGMHKTTGVSPVGESVLSKCKAAVDLIYQPAKSKFLEIAEGLGKKIVNGSAMLFYQAYYAQRIFLGKSASASVAKKLFEKYSGGNDL